MNAPNPKSLLSRLWSAIRNEPKVMQLPEPRQLAYGSTGFPGAGGYGPPTTPTLTSAGFARSSATGTRFSGGIITGIETNPDLTGRQWSRVAREMQRTDPVIRICVEGYLQTVRSATWKWEAGEDSPQGRFYRDFFTDMWGRMRYGWQDQQLSYLARYALTGFRYAEQIDVVRRGIDGELRTMVDFFADCEPESHWLWVAPDGGRTLTAVEQIDESSYPGSGGIDVHGNPVSTSTTPRTEANRLLLLIHGFTGANWGGDGGLLRPIYGAWKDKSDAANIQAAALRRFGMPTPHVKTNQMGMAEAGYTPDQIKLAREAAAGSARIWKAGGETFIESDSNIEFDFIGGEFDASNFNDTIRQRNDEIVMGMLQPFLGMGTGDSTGSRALSTQSASHFDVWVTNVLDNIASSINGEDRAGGGMVGRIMTSNGWNVPDSMFPRLVHTGLKADDFKDLAGVASAWAASGLFKSPAMSREALRRMDIPHDDEDIEILRGLTAGASESPAGAAGPGRDGLEGGAENPTPDRKPRTESV